MSTSLSIENLIDSSTPSSTSELLELDYDVMSFKKLYASLTMIEELTDRLGDLSSFLPAMEETLKFFSSFTFIYRYCGKEIVGLAETARETLESAGVVPYLWASCPESLQPHKRLYLQLLRLLQSKGQDIAVSQIHRRRLHALLMPLTSRFSIIKKSDVPTHQNSPSPPLTHEVPLYRTIHLNPDLREAGRSQGMPPPPAPPVFQTPVFRRRAHGAKSLTRSIKQRLWTDEDLLAPGSPPPRNKHRAGDTKAKPRPNFIDGDDDNDHLETSESEDVGVPFRQPRVKLRFGICFTGKSSSCQGGGRSNFCNLDR